MSFFYWIGLVIVWICIPVNLICIVINIRNAMKWHKKYNELCKDHFEKLLAEIDKGIADLTEPKE